MQQALFAIVMIVVTLASYFVMLKLYTRFASSFLIPALTASTLLVLILLVLDIPYDRYMDGGKWITSLLGPAVVALALPLYKQRKFLRDHLLLILAGVSIVGVVGMLSVAMLAKLIGLSHSLSLSIIPKSVTSPVAIAIAEGIGGNGAMAVVAVMIAGIFGAMLAPGIFKLLKVESAVGKGISLGGASHAIGTAKAAEYGELALSMSSVSMTLNAILSSFLGPAIAWLLFS